MKKRVLSLILAVVMVLCLVPAISVVSFAAEEDYSILPDDENKQHFLDVMAAYGDENSPTAAVINEKLTGYLDKYNKEMAVAEQAALIATTIEMFYYHDGAYEENVQIITDYLTTHPIGTVDQKTIANALEPLLRYVDGDAANGARAWATRNAANYVAWFAIKSTSTTVDDTTAATWADLIYTAGVWTPEVENVEATQEAYIATAIQKIIDDNAITTISREHGDNIITPLCDAVEFRAAINLGGATDVANVSNNGGFKFYVLSAIEQIEKQMNYGTNKVADFYLNFTDVKLEDDADFTDVATETEKLNVILDYYFSAGAGNYGYYEDLWYDDGHLIYFVDTANFNNEYTQTQSSVPTSDTDLTQVAVTPSHFARLVKASANGQSGAYMQANAYNNRSHVKIIGGYEQGRYFTVAVNNTNVLNLATEVNEDGYLKIYYYSDTNAQYNAPNYSGINRYAGIYLGYTYSYEQTYDKLTQHHTSAWKNTTYTDYNYFHDNGMTMTADADGYYGGYTMQFGMRIDTSYWSNPYYSSFANCTADKQELRNQYASQVGFRLMGYSADGGNGYDISAGFIHYGARWDATLNDGAGGYVMTYSFINSGYNAGGAVVGSTSKGYYADMGTYLSITTAGSFTDPARKVGELSYFKVNDQYATTSYQVFDVSNENTFNPNTNNTKRSANGGYASYDSIMVQMQDKLMSNFRAYDCVLTPEQIARNNFADLVYEKGVDLTVFNALSDVKKDAVIDVFANADFDTVTKAGIETQIEEISNTPVYDDEYKNYAHLWYDDGHLMTFVDLMNIADAERVEAAQFATDEQYIKDSYRLINGYSRHEIFDRTDYHSLIRVIGGQNAGRWLIIYSRYGGQVLGSGQYGPTDYKFPTVDGGFTDFGSTATHYSAGNDTGIFLALSYDDVTAAGKFNVPSSIVAENYFLPTANGGNAFTVDMAAYIATQSVSYPYSVFVSAKKFAQSADKTSIFIEGNNNNPNKQTESYGVFLTEQYNATSGAVNDFVNGFAGRFGGFSGKANINCSVHIASTVSYQSSNTFLTSYSVLLDHPTNGHGVVSKQANYPKVTEAFDGYPSYGAYANMNTVSANLANNNYYYYLRTYDVALTTEQMMQNHFADLMYYNRIDTAKYDALSDSDKATLWAWATDVKLSDATAKAEIEAKIDAMAEDNTSIINFKGFQARVSKNVGVRSVFYLDQSAIANAGVTVKAYGAIAGTAVDGADFDNFTISYDATNGVTVSSNAKMTASTDDDFKLIADVEKEFILGSAENLNNYTMFAYTVDFINGSIDRNGVITGTSMIDTLKDTEMFFRAFAVVEYKGATYIHYADGASANYDNSSVSLTEISEYYAAYNNGEFANNACIKAVVGTTNDEE